MMRFDGNVWSKPVVIAAQMMSPTFSMDGRRFICAKAA